MHEFTDQELFFSLQHARNLDPTAGRQLLTQFQHKQPALAHTLLNIFPRLIAQQQPAMSHYFMELCFDVLCVFEQLLGPLPDQTRTGEAWIEKNALLLNTELQAMLQDQTMNSKVRDSLQDNFVERMIAKHPQQRLNQILNEAILDFAQEHAISGQVVKHVATALFVSIQLLSSLYEAAENKTPANFSQH